MLFFFLEQAGSTVDAVVARHTHLAQTRGGLGLEE